MKTKSETQGRRLQQPPPHSWQPGEVPFQPGDYWKENGTWYGVTPNGLHCCLKNHHVEEYEDGTISVVADEWGSNSILVNGDRPNAWHGCIRRGVWREF